MKSFNSITYGVAGWALVISATAIAAKVSSVTGWALAGGFAVLPPLVLWRFWGHPAPTMSENIQQALNHR